MFLKGYSEMVMDYHFWKQITDCPFQNVLCCTPPFHFRFVISVNITDYNFRIKKRDFLLLLMNHISKIHPTIELSSENHIGSLKTYQNYE